MRKNEIAFKKADLSIEKATNTDQLIGVAKYLDLIRPQNQKDIDRNVALFDKSLEKGVKIIKNETKRR